MSKYATICKKCREKNGGEGTLRINGYSSCINDGKCVVPGCNGKVEDIALTKEEYKFLTKINKSVQFVEAMIDLKEKDPIEFQLKMSQFKTQVQQQESIKTQNDNTPRCPHCKSTNIKSISGLNRGASIAMWGIFSKKINKSFECKQCGYTW